MARLGSRKRPAIVRVQTAAHAQEIVAVCQAHGWQVIVGVEPDVPEDVSDVRTLIFRLRFRRFRGEVSGRPRPW